MSATYNQNAIKQKSFREAPNASAKRISRIPNLLINIALIFVGPLFLAIFLELSFRVYHFLTQDNYASLEEQLSKAETIPVQDLGPTAIGNLIQPSKLPNVVYELKPNIQGTFQGKAFQFNSFGARDKDYELKKPQGVKRIVGIGDSVMFGWGVSERSTYLNLIEEKLNSQNKNTVEVINFAVPGYNTAMEVATFQHKALAFEPDLVVLHFVDNDFDVPMFMQKPKDIWSLQDSFFIDFINFRLPSATNNNLVFGSLRNLGRKEKTAVLEQYKGLTGESGFRLALKNLSALTTDKGIDVVVVVGNLRGRMKKVFFREVTLRNFKVVEVKPFVDKYVKDNNIENTKATRQALLQVSPLDSHPNKLGHSLYAEALLSVIQTSAL